MKSLVVPKNYNYIAAFLTFACNLRCSYCINHFGPFAAQRKMLSGGEWLQGLNRIVSRDDLPLTLQGGEPSLHPDFYDIISGLRPDLHIDILTNLQFDVEEFISRVKPERLRRQAPYASIRVSYHPETMDAEGLIKKTLRMLEAGFSVGIWAVMHPTHEKHILEVQERCRTLGIDFRLKEFLGEHNDTLYGTYRYKGACDGKTIGPAECRTTEFLMDSAGQVFRCHGDLYAATGPVGNILSSDFQIEDKFRPCDHFGRCNPCDVKVKTDRFQQFGHTSVEVRFPEASR